MGCVATLATGVADIALVKFTGRGGRVRAAQRDVLAVPLRRGDLRHMPSGSTCRTTGEPSGTPVKVYTPAVLVVVVCSPALGWVSTMLVPRNSVSPAWGLPASVTVPAMVADR